MTKTLLSLAFVMLISMAHIAHAQVNEIYGPPLNLNESLQFTHGLAFTALDNSAITAFVYQNQGMEDVVTLSTQAAPGIILDSVITPAGDNAYQASVNWNLSSGVGYVLLAGGEYNGRYAEAYNLFPQSDRDISVTSGVFSDVTYPYDWGDFNNIVTEISPEPAGTTVFGVALLYIILCRKHLHT